MRDNDTISFLAGKYRTALFMLEEDDKAIIDKNPKRTPMSEANRLNWENRAQVVRQLIQENLKEDGLHVEVKAL